MWYLKRADNSSVISMLLNAPKQWWNLLLSDKSVVLQSHFLDEGIGIVMNSVDLCFHCFKIKLERATAQCWSICLAWQVPRFIPWHVYIALENLCQSKYSALTNDLIQSKAVCVHVFKFLVLKVAQKLATMGNGCLNVRNRLEGEPVEVNSISLPWKWKFRVLLNSPFLLINRSKTALR